MNVENKEGSDDTIQKSVFKTHLYKERSGTVLYFYRRIDRRLKKKNADNMER